MEKPVIYLTSAEADEYFQLLDDLEAMVKSGVLTENDGRYSVTPKGHALAVMAEARSA